MAVPGLQKSIDRLLALAATTHARGLLGRYLGCAKKAAKTQNAVLRAILTANADSDFGRGHGFAGIRRYDQFAHQVPIQTYDDLRPLVNRTLHGDFGALLGAGQRVVMFAKTSGSTDVPKYVPVTEEFIRQYRRGWNAFGGKALGDHPEAILRSILQTSSPIDDEVSPCGLPCGSISGMLAAAQKGIVRRFYAVPTECARIADAPARYYTIMRFAVPRDVSWMVTAGPATQLALAKCAAEHAQALIKDIGDGTLTPPGEISQPLRRRLAEQLLPDRENARRLGAIADSEGTLLPRQYWRLSFVANWTAGAMGLHLREFPHFFGDAPVRDIGLLATEGRVTVGLDDGVPYGLLDAGGAFFEFVEPDASASGTAGARRCHELDIGGEYRVIMTTWAGFYRYDLGDHVRVHGFVGEAPLLEFLHRGAYVSSVTGEKLTEWQVIRAFEAASAALAVPPRRFALAPVWAERPFYRLYLESREPLREVMADAVDAGLARINIEYNGKRTSGRLGAIRTIALQPGAFAAFDAERAGRHRMANEQYKPQCLFTKPGDDATLMAAMAPPQGAEPKPEPAPA
ncbi:MAG: GH3 auxin-responsive promoter family protein [Planctomycetota bacterium]